MSVSSGELYPSQEDVLYEEEILRNPFSLKSWWRYLIAHKESPFKKRSVIYERSLKDLPGSYKLWHAYLKERLEIVQNLQTLTEQNEQNESLNNTFERALITMHKMPRIWVMYLQTLIEQKLITLTHITFDRALCALPVTQHERIWEPYLIFVSQIGIPIETSVYNRYLKFDPNIEGSHSLKTGVLNDKDVDDDLRLARLEHLMERRPELANSVLLGQNSHNVEQWHRRVELFEGNPTSQILTYTEAVRTVDPMKAVGHPHTLWVALAKLYEDHKNVANARVIFDKAVQVNYKAVDNLASLWFEWAKLELRQNNFEGALELMRRATSEPSVEVKRRVAIDDNEPVQMQLHRCLRLWTFYVDLVDCLGTLESTRAVYERILDLRIATPQIIIDYALLLEEHKYFEDAFKVYERGIEIFKYPHVKDIWVTYLSKFVKRYGKSKLERARDLFEHAIEKAPPEDAKPLYVQYAKLEEDYGLAERAMNVYNRATEALPKKEKLSMYEIYIARAAEIFGVPETREIYERAIAIESGLPDEDIRTMCMNYADLEQSLGEIDHGRSIYIYTSQFVNPRTDYDFWNKWHDFEVQHGNEDTFRQLLRIKRDHTLNFQFMSSQNFLFF